MIERNKALLSERHLTFENLAQKMGKERSIVYKTISNGNPTLNFLTKLSDALGMSIDTIINLPSPKERPVIREVILDGFVEVNDMTRRIHSIKDLNKLYNKLNEPRMA